MDKRTVRDAIAQSLAAHRRDPGVAGRVRRDVRRDGPGRTIDVVGELGVNGSRSVCNACSTTDVSLDAARGVCDDTLIRSRFC